MHERYSFTVPEFVSKGEPSMKICNLLINKLMSI
ncbi:hypothetical protein MFDS1004839_04488 (plasmid) [Salmonella enterica]|nr:hypothetical protein MFDS1004839_04488 [Salmonella enterica]